ncbi:hypothetical protein [Kitasatospora sp. NPDC091207]
MYGAPGDRPLVGDWFGKGRMSFGVYRSSYATFAFSGAYAGIWGTANQLY